MNSLLALALTVNAPAINPAGPIQWRMQEIETTLKVGYGVVTADVNNDGKPDIVVADANRVVWYENPTWKRRTMIEGKVPPDIVCIAPCDIERNGKLAFFLGADWGRMNTTSGGTIHWMRRGKTLEDPWEVFKIGEEPTVHRMRVIKNNWGNETYYLVVAPLMGRSATKEANWTDGRPVRILSFEIPKNPAGDPWKMHILSDTDYHVVHNFEAYAGYYGIDLTVASYEGVSSKTRTSFSPIHELVSKGDQSNLKGNRGASEVKSGRIGNESFLTSVEPWHGNQIVAYASVSKPAHTRPRQVIDDKLRWGHALWCADLDGDKNDEIIAGVRDDLSKNPGERRGVRIYKCTDGKGEKWERQIVDDGGIACEDLTVADLNGDGRPDIIASGRQTGNARIYWNEGRK